MDCFRYLVLDNDPHPASRIPHSRLASRVNGHLPFQMPLPGPSSSPCSFYIGHPRSTDSLGFSVYIFLVIKCGLNYHMLFSKLSHIHLSLPNPKHIPELSVLPCSQEHTTMASYSIQMTSTLSFIALVPVIALAPSTSRWNSVEENASFLLSVSVPSLAS